MGEDRFIFKTDLKALLDIKNGRFWWNRSFNSYLKLFQKDLKNQKKSYRSYNDIGPALMKRIVNTFLDIMLKDVCENGETFKTMTKYGDVFIGIDKKQVDTYDINTGFDKYYLGIIFEDFFWMPYPFTVEYNIFLRKEYLDIIKENNNISTDYYEHKQIFHGKRDL